MEESTTITYKEKSYDFIKERRNRTRIYQAQDKKSFLRVGPILVIDEELRFHNRLISQGYPVPKILLEDSWSEDEKLFCESSAGEEHFGILFRNDVENGGTIREETFQSFLKIIGSFSQAQKKEITPTQNWESVFLATHFDVLIEELPEKEREIMAIWEKIKSDLKEVPFVLCHGDLNPFNILPEGIIDFETAFEGPLGYDLISASSSIDWFPRQRDAEFLAGYSFTENQRQQMLALLPDSARLFDALFVLRSVWLVVRMQKYPKLQVWRYTKFQEIMQQYLLRESLYQKLYSSN